MSPERYREENSTEVISWLQRLREGVPQWSDPKDPGIYLHSPNFFSIESMMARKFFVVPFPYCWMPSEDKTLKVISKTNCDRIYAAGFDAETEVFYSSPLDVSAVEDMQLRYLRYCINAPRDESFLILNTYLDYWLLAAPFLVIREITDRPLDKALDAFIASVREDEFFEAGKSFAESITAMYRDHNRLLRPRD